ncbi:uncharacterized protein LOC112173888 isoform X1 [Rosa chinensis]|uniref:uncharacterized protein LOC112173888 isoform X1 n=1 Tax=Rosa chinensis TaxID=74649 RepID=UPI001AD8FA7F|nr:uncharacterized protein LOC112173888 isoform X1 [Rosa chinensis]XP_040365472.1 uncharacterized protein LOC112173888 isoform X1 [Rosa chinensis]
MKLLGWRLVLTYRNEKVIRFARRGILSLSCSHQVQEVWSMMNGPIKDMQHVDYQKVSSLLQVFVRKHILKLEQDIELLKAEAKRKVEFSYDVIEGTPEDIECVESGAPQTSSFLDSNEAMRVAKLAKLDTEVNFWMYFARRVLLDVLLLWIKD